jgi:hypothetical protein
MRTAGSAMWGSRAHGWEGIKSPTQLAGVLCHMEHMWAGAGGNRKSPTQSWQCHVGLMWAGTEGNWKSPTQSWQCHMERMWAGREGIGRVQLRAGSMMWGSLCAGLG